MKFRAERDGLERQSRKGERDGAGDTEMEGSPPPEGGVTSMQVDGEAQEGNPSVAGYINQASADRGAMGTRPAESSPISSEVEPSSQSGGSAPSAQGPKRDIATSFPRAPPLPTETANVTIASAATSRTTSAYSSPRSQPSGSGSALSASLKSTASRGRRKSATSGVPFPIMTPSPASPRMDSTPAEAEDMLGIVSATDVHTFVSDTAGRPSIAHGSVTADPVPSPRRHAESSTSERIPSTSQDARARRVSSPEHTFRDSSSSAAIPIASSSRRSDFVEPFAGSLTRQMTGEQSKSASSQQQRFKRFMGSLFRSKSVSSTDSVHSMEQDEVTIPPSGSARNQNLTTLGEGRSPRRSHSMVPAVPPASTTTPQHSSKLDAPESYTKSPSAMSVHSSAHPGSVTPRIRTRSERSVSPGRTAHRQTTTTDVEMELDGKDGDSDAGDAAYPLKRVRSHRDAASAKTTSTTGVSGTAPPIDWKCRSTGSAEFDGIVTGLN